ncbi:MAG: phospho-N-acetylmuramoyl-pentapeptide-transferase, phospho-N-acetylmuramoyl-pentapeptide-transferase [Candidatus Parcubacteria bacterium]|jgi:phospho-N-acetylmuramoyl-pentapeptide-transferase
MIDDTFKVFVPAILAFWIGIISTPLLTAYLYHYKAWKKVGGKMALDGTKAVEFDKLHAENETRTPRMGGIVIWASTAVTALIMWLVAAWAPESFGSLDFVSRSQTWIPLTTLLVGAFVGLMNDILDVWDKSNGRGIPLSVRLSIVTILSLLIGSWFYTKLGVVAVGIPFLATDLYLGWLIVPMFVITSLFLYASGIIDGIDGLSGGVFASVFSAYAFIAFHQGQIDLAAFCATLVGGILAFLWFNVPPARFWMTETGSMALTLTVASVAFLTDLKGAGNGIAVLPIVGILLVATVLSSVLQVLSKKIYGKKIFRIAPLHHHFEAIGWPSHKVTMRYWILSIVAAITGAAIAVAG